uniref:RRM domain-containing protein n=1 Tax=Davidia involucrata TaxID=16924 RepID=A0A5B7BWR5_DAVIN
MSSVWFGSFATPQPASETSLANRTYPKSLKLHASLFGYPLASKIMVRNLSYSTSESRLLKEFSNFGLIAEVKLIKDEATKRSKGYAFIQYTSQDDAMLALESMDHKYFDGREIFVELAKLKNNFGGYPITSGPPKEKNLLMQDDAKE